MTRNTARFMPGLIALALTVCAIWLNLLAPVDRVIADLRNIVLQKTVASDVVIVAIDANSLRQLNRWPWPRDVHARLLQKLDQVDPHAVFFDIDFSVATGNVAADAALATALGEPRAYPLVLPAFWQDASAQSMHSRVLTEPLPELAQHAQIGMVNVFPGPGGLVRNAVHNDQFGQRQYRSVALQLTGKRDMNNGQFYPIDFSIAPRSFTYISYVDVLRGQVPEHLLRGKTIFIGATAVELGDNIPVPIYRAIPGVTLQATIYETLRQGVPQLASPWVTLVMLALLVVFWSRFDARGWRLQGVVCLLTFTALAGLSVYLQAGHNVLLDVSAPMLLTVLALFASIVANADRQTVAAFLASLRLKREQALISGVLETSIDGILVIDASGHIHAANPAAASLFGVKTSALAGRALQTFLPALKPSAKKGREVQAGRRELSLQTAQGTLPVEVSISPPAEEAQGLMTVIVRDIRERYRQQAVLRHQASHDSLTGLPNRALLAKHLSKLKSPKRAALFMLDLDGFKTINDTLGHRTGDQILRVLGKRLRRALPKEVCVFRIGGDEFAVLVASYTRPAELQQLAEDILQRVREPLAVANTNIELGGSIGIALYPQHAEDGGMLLQCADVAMYTAKRKRSGIEFYDAESDHNTLRNLKMTGLLRQALADQQLTMVYQPKVRLEDQRCTGVEALVRWNDAELGVVSPAEFIPLAETGDLIESLTLFTLNQALHDHAQWCARGIDLKMSVNLSARHVTDSNFVKQILAAVERHGVSPERLELEITETALMDQPERAQTVLAQLTQAGVHLAMDDYGTGFSSLAYLKHLNLHTLKIDQCFVRDLCQSDSDRKIVNSTLNMAHSLDLEVVAEGIEDDAQAALLKDMGCDVGQGYGLGKPMAASDFIDWYVARHGQRQTNVHRFRA